MEGIGGPKKIIKPTIEEPINDTNKVSSESIPENVTPDEKKKNIDPYFKWMIERGVKGETDFSELNYIKEAIINESKEDIEKALKLTLSYYENREDLIAKLYILKGDFEQAKKIILEYKDRDLDEVMVDSLSLLLKKNPEKRDNIMWEVNEKNPKLLEYIKNRY